MKPHNFTGMLVKHRQMYHFCVYCGLIALKNDVTKKAMNKPCPGKE
jgi:hypothetical protein